MKKRHLLFLMALTVSALSVTGCNKEKQEEVVETSAVETTAEQFTLGELDVEVYETEGTTSPEETKVVEIYDIADDGTTTGKTANGDIFVETFTPGSIQDFQNRTESLPASGSNEVSTETGSITDESVIAEVLETQPDVSNEFAANKDISMTEEEYISYDNIASFWMEHPDLSEEYLEEMLLSEQRFPSLSESERQSLLNELRTVHPHDPSETVA